MPTEMVSGVLAARFARLGVELRTREAVALTATAQAVMERARHNLTAAAHPYGTHTPARPGGPPAMITGTLASSLAMTRPSMGPLGMVVHVGLTAGATPWYGRTPANKYGYYLEVPGAGTSHIRYPWLMPAVHAVGHTAAFAALRAAFVGFGRF